MPCSSAVAVFDNHDLMRCILRFVYPRRTKVGMHVRLIGGQREARLKGRLFEIHDIRLDDEFGVVVVSETPRPCNRGVFHRVQTFFYPDMGDILRVVPRPARVGSALWNQAPTFPTRTDAASSSSWNE